MIQVKKLVFFFFNDTATTEIYTLSLHDALPISALARFPSRWPGWLRAKVLPCGRKSAGCAVARDRRGAGDRETPPPPSGPAAPLVLGAGHDWEIGRAHRWNPVTATPRMPTSSFEKKQLTRDHSRHSET